MDYLFEKVDQVPGTKLEGELKSSEEGRVFWLDRKDVASANLIWNMRELLEIFETNEYSEFFFDCRENHKDGKLLGNTEVVRTLG